jgi:thioredoxin-dependent peroxiredoxin
MGVSLLQGQKAPEFELLDQDGNTVRLSNYRGKKTLVYFYPKADTPGCTAQSCALRDSLQDLKNVNVEVIGISPDPVSDQKKFDVKYKLGFPLLSDTSHSIADAYGVWGTTFYVGVNRSSFLIDENGFLVRVWYGVKPQETVPFVREALKMN